MTATSRTDERSGWPFEALATAGGEGFELVATDGLCNAKGMLFGGWALGMVVQAGQVSTGLWLRDLSASYLAPIRRGARIRIVPDLLSAGRTLSQVRLDAWTGDMRAVAATAVFGPGVDVAAFPGKMPDVPLPGDCPERAYDSGGGTGSSQLLETRVASETPRGAPEPRALLWVGLRCEVDGDVRVAVVSDHVPSLVRRSMPDFPFVPTVSGTLRIFGRATSRFLLLDVRVSAWDGVLASGDVNIWNEDGTLVASAGQTIRRLAARLPA